VGIPVRLVQEIQFFAPGGLVAIPTSLDVLVKTAFPDYAEGGTTTVPASFLAPKLHHQSEHVIAFPVLFETLCEGKFGQGFSEFVVMRLAELTPETACKVGNFSRMAVTIEAAEPAIGNQGIVFHGELSRREEGECR